MTAPVSSFPPNTWGIYDTAGNVAEWTLDDLHPNYEGAPTDGSPWISAEAREKVYRGGAWQYPARELRSATRDWAAADFAHKAIGFRLIVKEIPRQQEPAK